MIEVFIRAGARFFDTDLMRIDIIKMPEPGKQYRVTVEETVVPKQSPPVNKFIEQRNAHAAGKQIQFRSDFVKAWSDIDDPTWHSENEYRIKPDPEYMRFSSPRGSFIVKVIDYALGHGEIVLSRHPDPSNGFGVISKTFSWNESCDNGWAPVDGSDVEVIGS